MGLPDDMGGAHILAETPLATKGSPWLWTVYLIRCVIHSIEQTLSVLEALIFATCPEAGDRWASAFSLSRVRRRFSSEVLAHVALHPVEAVSVHQLVHLALDEQPEGGDGIVTSCSPDCTPVLPT